MSVPSASSSKGRTRSRLDSAGVFEKHRYIRMVFSASHPPLSIRSARPDASSATAIRSAARELAQAASTVQLVAPRSNRLAIRPATTLPSIPGKEFSSQGAKAAVNFAAISSASVSVSPQLRTTSLRTGVCNRAESGWVRELEPVTPRMTPVRDGSYQLAEAVPASARVCRATTRLRSWSTPVTPSVVGGSP